MPQFTDYDPKGPIAQMVSRATETYASRDFKHKRVPFIITCEKWSAVQRHIILYCNPSEAEFSFPFREAEQEIKGGIVRHSWRSHGSYFREPTIDFTFHTGNVMPRLENGRVEMAPGLENLYDMLELLDTERLWRNQANYVSIAFNSMTFPSLVMRGFFSTDDFTIPQSVDKLHGFDFSLKFVARSFTPSINTSRELVAAFRDSSAFAVKSAPNEMTFSEEEAGLALLNVATQATEQRE